MTSHDVDVACGILRRCLPQEGQPGTFFRFLDTVLQDSMGFVFNALFVIRGGRTLRVHSTDEAHYPVGVEKPMAQTTWGNQVLTRRQPYLAKTRASIVSAFPDHALIERLGCGSAINVPVVFDDACLGTINLNAAEHHYDEGHLAFVVAIAPAVVPAFLAALRRAEPAAAPIYGADE